MFHGGFLEDLGLDDFDEFQAWRVAQRERFRGLHVRLLQELTSRLGALPEQALAPARELVRLRPEDAHSRGSLVRLLAATGRAEEAEEHYNLGRRQIERAGGDASPLREAWRAQSSTAHDAHAQAGREPERADDGARQQVRLCTAPDGVRIAFATLGQGPPLVKTANWLTHLEFDWKSPLWRHLARELAAEYQLVRYDQRGNGLLDWSVEDFSLEACLGDLEAVVDTLGLTRGCGT